MDIYIRPEQEEDSQEEEGNFTQYMDENGIIGIEEERILQLDEQRVLDLGEQNIWGLEEHRLLDLDVPGTMGMDEQEILQLEDNGLSPEPSSDDDPSAIRSLDEDFSFSQKERSHEPLDMEYLRKSEVIAAQHDTDWDLPSRDQQLDMTEDEQDRGSSEEMWEEEEEEDEEEEKSLSQGLSGAPYDTSFNLLEFEELAQTSNPPISSLEESYTESTILQEYEPSTFSLSLTPHPISNSWDHPGGLKLSPRIEDETLPESSNTDSGDGRDITPPEDLRRISISKARNQRSLPTFPSSTFFRRHHKESTGMKTTKPSAAPNYGRGQLNYPLPDFSKVGPRVRFPRDDNVYQPPQSRRPDLPAQDTPVIFKSPADIVREVLLNSTEKPTEEASMATVPQEFQTPQHATELVHQLQKDYHKLLTKYAEAENTIDRLRLGAKVHLYSDPPKPSHSAYMGFIPQGSKLSEFTIPQMQVATLSSMSETNGVIEASSVLGSSVPISTVASPDDSSPVTSLQHPPDDQATLTVHIDALSGEVDLLEELLHAGKFPPEQQWQAVWELRGSLEGLEQRYLRAREEILQGETQMGNNHQPEDVDPRRVLEAAIFQLGVRLDEIQDRMKGSNVQLQLKEQDLSTMDSGTTPPVPSSKTPQPALPPSYPEVAANPENQNKESPGQAGANMGLMNTKVVVVQEDLPQPLRHKQMHMEKEYDTLLSTYNSFKTLPDALGLQQAERPKSHLQVTSSQGQLQETKAQDSPQHPRSQKHLQATTPPDHPQTVRFQEHLQVFSPNEHTTAEEYEENPQASRLEDLPLASEPQYHPQATNHQELPWGYAYHDHLETGSLQDEPKSTRHEDHLQAARHYRGRSPKQKASASRTPSHSEPHKAPNDWVQEQSSPESGRYPRKRSVSSSSQAVTPHFSLSPTSLHQERNHSSRSPVAETTLNRVRAQSPHSQRSSISSRSGNSLAQRKSTRNKRNSVQDGILSPETDSGFLGSESSRLSLLQKQRNPMIHSSSPNQKTKGLSQIERDQTPRTRRAFQGRRTEGDEWTRQSQARSPSPGPKSLTESESREQSPTGASDFENEGDGLTLGASLPRSPNVQLYHRNGDLLETRAARDQAIQDLQKEVIHLRQRLEKCLNSSSTQEKPNGAQPVASIRGLQDLTPTRSFLFSDRGAAMQETGSEAPQASGSTPRPNLDNKNVRGAYTGTTYLAPETSPTAPCSRCQDSRGPEVPGGGSSGEGDRSPHKEPHCVLCHDNGDSTERIGVPDCHICRRRARSPRVPRSGRWVFSEVPPVNMSYMQTPLISYSAQGIYAPAPNLYLPMGYNVTPPQPSHTVTPPPAPYSHEDISWSLSRALEAAKKLKTTSRKMCRSLTSDLGSQRSLRSSCLF